ncbi:hypothetical protein Calkr_2651 (plasmid) [Caldicellulosiruptor acetigenus I77R1B]|uniref:Uncharacterized protein n=1 Tax=Caldicellulosiruptor acetigenus (strain ATCC 700853 / DSM 12137 / I77R1B) TaxID=632335 RepID=E4SAZ5_CALA7|nr:hypothetical protein [Caldicellulosiruptor acetigenus]ADQ42074.1 hypothetical protein Calkr_2651 [Caldicellulosiruptor acetigenus I77R1B]
MGRRKENKIRSRTISVRLPESHWIFKIEGNKSSIIESALELYKTFVLDANRKANSITNFEYRQIDQVQAAEEEENIENLQSVQSVPSDKSETAIPFKNKDPKSLLKLTKSLR